MDDDELEKKAKDRAAFWKLQSAFREFEHTYDGGERWYYKIKRAPGVYIRAATLPNPSRFTIVREDVQRSNTEYVPSNITNNLVLWDSTWMGDENQIAYDHRIEIPWQAGILLHGVLIMEDEIKDEITVLIQREDGFRTRLHVSPMKVHHRMIMEGVEGTNGTLDDMRECGYWVPKHWFEDRSEANAVRPPPRNNAERQ